jgi:hypothetical protein
MAAAAAWVLEIHQPQTQTAMKAEIGRTSEEQSMGIDKDRKIVVGFGEEVMAVQRQNFKVSKWKTESLL